MSGLAEIGQRAARLQEISGIMTAMKSLALVETRKLARILPCQRAMLDNIESALADFLPFWPTDAEPQPAVSVLVAIGAERGFCGSFDERLVRAWRAWPEAQRPAVVLAVGERLIARLSGEPKVQARIEGATSAEDIPAVLNRLVDALRSVSVVARGPVTLVCLAHDAQGIPASIELLPFRGPSAAPRTQAPQTNLAPTRLLAAMLDQYLPAALLGQLYTSLAAESHQRLAHLDNALDRLDETAAALAVKRNALRQERIVEEIEVMLSNAMALRESAR